MFFYYYYYHLLTDTLWKRVQITRLGNNCIPRTLNVVIKLFTGIIFLRRTLTIVIKGIIIPDNRTTAYKQPVEAHGELLWIGLVRKKKFDQDSLKHYSGDQICFAWTNRDTLVQVKTNNYSSLNKLFLIITYNSINKPFEPHGELLWIGPVPAWSTHHSCASRRQQHMSINTEVSDLRWSFFYYYYPD
jgi:hypothetical protein